MANSVSVFVNAHHDYDRVVVVDNVDVVGANDGDQVARALRGDLSRMKTLTTIATVITTMIMRLAS